MAAQPRHTAQIHELPAALPWLFDAAAIPRGSGELGGSSASLQLKTRVENGAEQLEEVDAIRAA